MTHKHPVQDDLEACRQYVLLRPPRTIELIFDPQSDGVDLALGLPVRFGIGYGLPHPEPVPYVRRCCF